MTGEAINREEVAFQAIRGVTLACISAPLTSPTLPIKAGQMIAGRPMSVIESFQKVVAAAKSSGRSPIAPFFAPAPFVAMQRIGIYLPSFWAMMSVSKRLSDEFPKRHVSLSDLLCFIGSKAIVGAATETVLTFYPEVKATSRALGGFDIPMRNVIGAAPFMLLRNSAVWLALTANVEVTKFIEVTRGESLSEGQKKINSLALGLTVGGMSAFPDGIVVNKMRFGMDTRSALDAVVKCRVPGVAMRMAQVAALAALVEGLRGVEPEMRDVSRMLLQSRAG